MLHYLVSCVADGKLVDSLQANDWTIALDHYQDVRESLGKLAPSAVAMLMLANASGIHLVTYDPVSAEALAVIQHHMGVLAESITRVMDVTNASDIPHVIERINP